MLEMVHHFIHLCTLCIGTRDLWPYLILLQAVPALLSLVVLPFLPETPRYLLLVLRDREGAIKGKYEPPAFIASSSSSCRSVAVSISVCSTCLEFGFFERLGPHFAV